MVTEHEAKTFSYVYKTKQFVINCSIHLLTVGCILVLRHSGMSHNQVMQYQIGLVNSNFGNRMWEAMTEVESELLS